MYIFTWLDTALAVFGILLVWRLLIRAPRFPLPPGPKKIPLIGNVLDMPTEQEWLTFAKWGERWGDIVSVTVFGQPLIVLNSTKAAIDMLERKSSIYSDRPVLQMGGELVGWKNTLVHSAMRQFHPIEEKETHRFLRLLLDSPDDLVANIRTTAGAIILRLSHGYEVRQHKDPLVELADRATEQFSLSTAPGAFLVDVLPVLRYVPDWFPGAGFKRTASEWATTLQQMADEPFEFVKQQMAAGVAERSFTSNLLEGGGLTSDDEFDIKWSSASLYSAGADTTVSAIHAFFLAMTLYPGVQKKAQAELDRVIGNDRLPSYADRDELPYINALCKEVLRWHSVTPSGVTHRLIADDVHEGYFIPKGSLIITNVWQMMHDPRIYTDPTSFRPERFIASGDSEPERDPREACFGFGRRICPGKMLADASVFISCAMVLAAFDITKRVENGVVIEPVPSQTTGTISHPGPFKCTITPRSVRAVALIQAEERS